MPQKLCKLDRASIRITPAYACLLRIRRSCAEETLKAGEPSGEGQRQDKANKHTLCSHNGGPKHSCDAAQSATANASRTSKPPTHLFATFTRTRPPAAAVCHPSECGRHTGCSEFMPHSTSLCVPSPPASCRTRRISVPSAVNPKCFAVGSGCIVAWRYYSPATETGGRSSLKSAASSQLESARDAAWVSDKLRWP